MSESIGQQVRYKSRSYSSSHLQVLWEITRVQRCHIAGRDISNQNVWRMSKLPECEVLDDSVSDYDYTPDVSQEPLRFRFRCGEGVVMPMLPDDASTTQAAEREAPTISRGLVGQPGADGLEGLGALELDRGGVPWPD